jgi:alkylhydroperoxidase family enzyme
MYGLSDEEIAALRDGRLKGFAPPETALLRMAEAMAETPSNVSDELYAELRRYFSEEQLIELAASAAQENFRARYNRVFDAGSDGLYRKGLRFKERPSAETAERPRKVASG